jgi:hypothetical protein
MTPIVSHADHDSIISALAHDGQMSARDKPILSDFWYRIYPELRHFKSREELREAKRCFRRYGLRQRRIRLMVLIMAPVACGLSLLGVRWLRSFGLDIWLVTSINTAFWALVGASASLFLWHRPYVRFVRQYLQDRGVAVCLRCGYDLSGQSELRCPECGLAFDVTLLR